MPRQSITFTKPNDDWLKSQIESEEYSSKSELVNDLLRQARGKQKEMDYVRIRIGKAKESIASNGYVTKTKDEILKEFKEKAKRDGLI